MTDTTVNDDAAPLLAAGVLILTRSEPRQFLLMRHSDRWDLPKGHLEPGETVRETSLREMEEETGVNATNVELDPNFEYVVEYPVQYSNQSSPRLKRVHYFLAWIDQPCDILCTEHESANWFRWQPPHQIQSQTIDPLLAKLTQHLG